MVGFGIWRSDDNGANWVYDRFSESELFKDVTYDSSTGHFVAVAGAGHVFKCSAGGARQSPRSKGVADDLASVSSNGSDVLVAVEPGARTSFDG